MLQGMTQGRLVHSADGQLQCFPHNRWEEEFDLARQVGLNYIEWMAERQHNQANPIWSDGGVARIRAVMEEAGLEPHSAVNDYPIDHDLAGPGDAVEQTLRLLAQAAKLKLHKLVVPLYEASEIQGKEHGPFVVPLQRIASRAAEAGIEICLETTLSAGELLRLLEQVDQPNVSACFDTGNQMARGQDIYGDILLLGSCIKHVHIKDKDRDGRSVFLGTGRVDFYRLAQCLVSIGYSEGLTFETPRGKDPVETAHFHKRFLDFFLGEAAGDTKDPTVGRR